MIKIRTKLFLFFLMNAIFLCVSTAFAISYIQKLSSSIESASSLRNATDDILIHSEDFLKIARSFLTVNPDKYDALKSEIDYALTHFDHSIFVMEKDGGIPDYVRNIKNIRDQYVELSENIISNRKSYSQQTIQHSDTLADLRESRHGLAEIAQDMSIETELMIVQLGYYEKEFNFQYEDKERADRWISSINQFKDSPSDHDEDFSRLLDSYSELATKCVIQKNALIDLEMNNGYYLTKIDNISIENRIQNAKVTDYIDSKIQKIQNDNDSFRIISVLFILFLLIFGGSLSILYSRRITDSITDLTNISKKIMDGDLSVRSTINSKDEMDYLSKTFNKMLDKINEKNNRLKKESMQLKILLSSINEGLLLIDKDYNILLSNAAAPKIIRTQMGHFRGKNLKDIVDILHNMDSIPPDKWPFEYVFNSGKSISLKLNDGYYFKTKEGRIFPVELATGPIDNGFEKGAVVVFKDTTEMKLIEEEREFSRKNLESVLKSIYIERDNVQEEKDKLEALLNSMGDAVLAIDEEKKVIAFNPVAEKMTGLKISELEKNTFDEKIKFIEEETKKEKSDFIEKVLAGGEKAELNDLAIFNKKGKMVLVDINAAPIKNYKGKIIGCIIIFKDVTFKREAERMRTDFISIVSHQLRTPLSAMKWFLEILLDGDVGKLKKEQTDVIKEIHESNKSMIDFVNQMLNVSRIESHRLAINIEKIKLCDTISELLKEIKPFFKEKKQRLSYSCIADKKLEINTDKNLLRNVLSSVLLNASRYTPQKGNIDLEVSRFDKNFVLFKVKDNGIGIPDDEKVKIFRKFARASNAIRYEANGTGLGLYIVKSIINMVCGKIWFESAENKGTTFFFTIPIENMVCEIDENDAKMLI